MKWLIYIIAAALIFFVWNQKAKLFWGSIFRGYCIGSKKILTQYLESLEQGEDCESEIIKILYYILITIIYILVFLYKTVVLLVYHIPRMALGKFDDE